MKRVFYVMGALGVLAVISLVGAIYQRGSSAAPVHYWMSRDGDEYLYQAALSADQKAAGQNASNIVRYTFRRHTAGKWMLMENDPGQNALVTCDDPCKTVTFMVRDPFGGVESREVVFSDTSIVGEAIHDAMDGQMAQETNGEAF